MTRRLTRRQVLASGAATAAALLPRPARPAQAAIEVVRHVDAWRKPGRYGGWPANHGIWSWGDEIVVGFQLGDERLPGGRFPGAGVDVEEGAVAGEGPGEDVPVEVTEVQVVEQGGAPIARPDHGPFGERVEFLDGRKPFRHGRRPGCRGVRRATVLR